MQRAQHDEEIEADEQQRAEQSELLADDGEHEVGGALGQELELSLCTAQKAFAGDAARADGDGRLDDVVARAERIGLRIEEGEHALALVVVQQVPAAPSGRGGRDAQQSDDPDPQPREQHHQRTAHQDQQARAEVWLDDGQRRRQQDHRGERQQGAPVGRQRPLVQIPRAGHGHRELHDLRGLEAHEAEVQPALRALADVADEIDDDQQHEPEDVQPRRDAAQEPRLELGADQHQRRADREPRRAARHRAPVPARGTVEHDLSVERDQREADQQRAVQPQRRQQLRRACKGTACGAVDLLADHSPPPTTAGGATTAPSSPGGGGNCRSR